MLAPLVAGPRIRKGILAAHGLLVKAIRAIEHHPANVDLPPLLVVPGLLAEDALYPIGANEEVLLLLPPRDRWLVQLKGRIRRGVAGDYDDVDYATRWYDRFEAWSTATWPHRRIEVPVRPELASTGGLTRLWRRDRTPTVGLGAHALQREPELSKPL